jgi:cytochrome bd-type quinol oxidase subunit 1
MNDFIAARSQMALSLAFHIIFSCIGMVMPFFMAVSHYFYCAQTRLEYHTGLEQRGCHFFAQVPYPEPYFPLNSDYYGPDL